VDYVILNVPCLCRRVCDQLCGRSVTTNIEQIQATQIERLTRRVRELERGLDELWSTISVEKHPLLRDDGMMVSGPSTPPVEISTPSPIHHDSSIHRDNIINYLGTLNIGPKGDSCFYGATARGEFSLKTSHQRRDVSYFRHTRLSERVLSVPFPEAPPELIAPDIRQMVYSHLPLFEDARGACELFLNYSSYMTSSLTREEMLHILETVYQNKSAPSPFLNAPRLLRFLAGEQTLNLQRIISAFFSSCSPCRDCCMAKTIIQWNRRTISSCLA